MVKKGLDISRRKCMTRSLTSGLEIPTRKHVSSVVMKNKEVNMTQAENDLEQLIRVRKDLANVYKSQATDNILDNSNLSTLNNAILNVNSVIRWLEGQQPKQ